jgi:sarcosine oxidase
MGDAEFLVVGAGVLGLSAARALGRRGRQVVVCERVTVGHDGSGSKGTARIFRLGYDDPGYVAMAMVAERRWRQLEAESGTAILKTTGQVTFGDDLDVLVEAMTKAGAAHDVLGPDEVTARFPALSVSGPAVYEPRSGVIEADRCLDALMRVSGVEMRPNTHVVGLHDEGDRVRVVVETPESQEELRVSGVVVCAGPGSGPLLGGIGVDLHLRPTLEQVVYLAPRQGTVEGIPVFVERRRPWFYGLPVAGSGLVKISLHGAGPVVPADGHDFSDDPDPALVAELRASARRVLPGMGPEPVGTERCVYDNSPDGDFVIDRVGSVVIGAGTSGHGFKFAPVIGEVLADLATGGPGDGELGALAVLGRFGVRRLQAAGSGGGPTRHP